MHIIHTMIRVGNLDQSIKFYTEVIGMRLLRRTDYPEGKFTLAFLGFAEEHEAAALELTYNWGVDKYELGNGYGHIALGTSDVSAAVEQIRARGGKIILEPKAMGKSTIAFVVDPDGYQIELVSGTHAGV